MAGAAVPVLLTLGVGCGVPGALGVTLAEEPGAQVGRGKGRMTSLLPTGREEVG